MSTPPGQEFKFFMAKTELVMEVGQAWKMLESPPKDALVKLV